MIAPDSAMVLPASVMTGDLPSGCTAFSSGGARGIPSIRWYLTISYGVPSSSRSHRMRCERRSEEHTSELQSLRHLVCRLLLEKKKNNRSTASTHVHSCILRRDIRYVR